MKFPKCSEKKAKYFAEDNGFLWDDRLSSTFKRMYLVSKKINQQFYSNWILFSSYSAFSDSFNDYPVNQVFSLRDSKDYLSAHPKLNLSRRHLNFYLKKLEDFYFSEFVNQEPSNYVDLEEVDSSPQPGSKLLSLVREIENSLKHPSLFPCNL